MFTLTEDAINAISQIAGIKAKLSLALRLSENSVNRIIRDNVGNGDLTKEAALRIIEQETGLSRDLILAVENAPLVQS